MAPARLVLLVLRVHQVRPAETVYPVPWVFPAFQARWDREAIVVEEEDPERREFPDRRESEGFPGPPAAEDRRDHPGRRDRRVRRILRNYIL